MYRIVSGNEVRSAYFNREEDEVERLGKIAREYFPELTEHYFCLPDEHANGGYIFNFLIDKESKLPVAIGCDDLKYDRRINRIVSVPDMVTSSPVFNEDELIEKCLYLRKRYHEILKEIRIGDIKNCGGEYVVG